MILVIDNYDSFVHNLARYLTQLGQVTRVVRNDSITSDAIESLRPAAIVLSPGPGRPTNAGRSLEIVDRFAHQIPMLGVCLGHQILAQAFGGRILRSAEPVHGRSSLISHTNDAYFSGLPNPLRVGRYHSLVVEAATLPDCLRPIAHTADGTLMAMEHTRFPILGLQFHPESVLTEGGYDLLSAFLRRVGLATTESLPQGEQFEPRAARPANRWPLDPVTF